MPEKFHGQRSLEGCSPWGCSVRHNRATGYTHTQFRSVQSLSRVRRFVTPWTAACQAPVHHQLPEFTQLMAIELMMPSNHLVLCRPLLLLPSVFPSVRLFSSESVCDKYRRLGDLNCRGLCFCGSGSWNLKLQVLAVWFFGGLSSTPVASCLLVSPVVFSRDLLCSNLVFL